MQICELHNDYLTELKDNKEIKNYLQNQKKLKVLLSPIWTTKLKDVKAFTFDKLNLIKNLNINYDIKLCFEDMGFFGSDFDFLKKVKTFYAGLVWNDDNKYAGGAYGKGNLTKKGKILVQNLENENIYVDTAHMNICTFNSFLSVTNKPIFCSHTGFYDIVPDKRNLTKNQIEDIVKSNGLVGLYFAGKYISKNRVQIKDVVKNIKCFVDNFGYKNLAVGSDFYGTTDLPKGISTYKDFSKIEQELVKNGINKSQIDAIFYKNFLNFQKNCILN